MGLDMSVYATQGEELNNDNIWDVDKKEYYWRKANAIHHWFVENVQQGEDDCGIYEVTTENLRNLKDDVMYVLSDMSAAPQVLPTAGGFFFGSTDYDEWYREDLLKTLEHVGDMLKHHQNNPNTKFYYHSSW